jgi:hypothetical protein
MWDRGTEKLHAARPAVGGVKNSIGRRGSGGGQTYKLSFGLAGRKLGSRSARSPVAMDGLLKMRPYRRYVPCALFGLPLLPTLLPFMATLVLCRMWLKSEGKCPESNPYAREQPL